MGKRYTKEEIELLSKNSNIKHADKKRVILSFEFRHRLWELWVKDPGYDIIRSELALNGIDYRMLGRNYVKDLIKNFIRYGEPTNGRNSVFGQNSLNFKTDPEYDKYLLSTGVFVKSRKGITFSNDFINMVYNDYPECTIESKLIQYNIDPEKVGYQRIYQLKNRLNGTSFSKKNDLIYGRSVIEKYTAHPYVNRITQKQFSLKESFYREACIYSPYLSIDDIMDMFELIHDDFSIESRNRIKYKLSSFENTDTDNSYVPDDKAIFNRIMENKEKALLSIIEDNFQNIAYSIPSMKKKEKKVLCKWIRDFPYESGKTFTVRDVLGKLHISKSSYYSILKNDNYGNYEEIKENKDIDDTELIRQVIKSEVYPMGYRTVYMKMKDITGAQLGLNRIRKLMKMNGLNPEVRRGNNSRKSSRELLKRNVKPNLLKRQFRFNRPLTTFLSDVSYLKYGINKVAYLSPIKDGTTGRILGAVVSECNDIRLGEDTLMLLENIDIEEGSIFHTDQGAIYLNDTFQKKVKSLGMNESMSRRGNCWDNASQESFFGHFKDECSYSDCATIEELRQTVYDYIDYYNNRRPQWTRNKMTPVQYEQYLNSMNDEEFALYQAHERKKYDKMMVEAKEKAIRRAHDIGA